MHPCIVIPVFNHGHGIGRVLESLRAPPQSCALPVLLIDDGSDADCAAILRALADAEPERLTLHRRERNGGKGAAVIDGLRLAQRLGFSHALQIDADGQHNSNDLPRFLATAEAHPQALITGIPVYDDSVPAIRLYGRYLSHVCVWINTLSLEIRDSLCGFRVYPLASTLALIDSEGAGKHMEFDCEILVRLHWRGVTVINLPTAVHYPNDGVSHFRLLRDNVLIAGMHARLFLGMLRRLPVLLRRRWR
ncbi:glycosyltransferase family 2 protein [Alloalcanivorax mobilis]|uniref:glycosyltransferase family 2 protein n=1 Tax=Alloalcanivorax mobilis TaxID=2019569 RepID=UPI000C767598|nr:glycosyltransferase family 2 protein [Alloalcanivorax mobilis]